MQVGALREDSKPLRIICFEPVIQSHVISVNETVITALKFQWFSMFVNPWTSVYVFFNLILNQFHKFVDILITHLYNRKEEL